MVRRRTVLAGLAAASVLLAPRTGHVAGLRVRGDPARPRIPAAPAGDERLTVRHSEARGRRVEFYTAVPAGFGDGRGLPVCLVLHGGSKAPRDFSGTGLGGFLTDAVRRGAPPFVLAGASGDRLAWRPHPGDDPQRMVHDEIPAWCAERGFDTSRLAVWGWSMGGYGALLLASVFPGFVRCVAAFSPAVSGPLDVSRLTSTPVGLWCGRDDPLFPQVRALPIERAAGSWGDGRHSFTYWSRIIPEAFDFVGRELSGTGRADRHPG